MRQRREHAAAVAHCIGGAPAHGIDALLAQAEVELPLRRDLPLALLNDLYAGTVVDDERLARIVGLFRLRGETKISARIKVDELPASGAVPYLDSDEAVAAYLSDILKANDAELLSAALGDIARVRGMTQRC